MALGLAYFAVAALTVRFTRFEGGVAFIWAAGPLLLSVLIASERARWPEFAAACAVGSCAATGLFGLGWPAALPMALVNVAEALLAAAALRRFCPTCSGLASLREVCGFFLIAGLAAPACSAFAGAAVAWILVDSPYAPNWIAWFAGHALGVATLTPLALLLFQRDMSERARAATVRRRVEALILFSAAALTSAAVFAQTRFPLLFLPLLPMMICVFRLGRVGAAVSTAILAATAGVMTVRGLGPVALIDASAGVKAQFLQIYLAAGVAMMLPAAGELRRRSITLVELQEQAALYRLTLDRTSDVVMTLEPDGRVRFASPSVKRVLGREPETLVGTLPHALVHPDDVDSVVAAHREALANPERTCAVEYRVVEGDEVVGWFETHARATLDQAGAVNGAVHVIRDVSDRRSRLERLETAAFTDQLTQLPNRRAFDQRVAGRLSRTDGPAACLALFDLDRFKLVNDTWGHAAGDKALRAFAEVLRGCVRERDFVARMGGEEFVALIDGADLEVARSVCERVRTRMAGTALEVAGGRVAVTVSAGIAVLPPGGSMVDALADADAALYRAKQAGRNRLALAA